MTRGLTISRSVCASARILAGKRGSAPLMAKGKSRAAKPRGKKGAKALVARIRRRLPGPQEIARDIDRRIATYMKSANKRSTKPSVTFESGGVKKLNLVAHGDSWFNYPVSYDEHP